MPTSHRTGHAPAPRTRPVRSAPRTHISMIMSRQVITAQPELELGRLVDLMLEKHLSRLPVVDEGGRLVGLISKTDIVRAQRSPGLTQVGHAMSKPVLSLCDSISVAEAARLLAAQSVHGAPVIDDAGRLVGWLSAMDVVAWLAGQR